MFSSIDTIIAGAGITGATIARTLAEKGKNVLIIEKSNEIGGNCFDYRNNDGLLIHKYGPHIFHTGDKVVWDFLSRFTEWKPYFHKVGAYIDSQIVPLPFNFNTMKSLFSDSLYNKIENKLLEKFEYGSRVPILDLIDTQDNDLNFLAQYVYEKVFLNYTVKQWGGKKPEELDPMVSGRVPVVISKNNDYFNDCFQGMPTNGFTEMIRNIVDHPKIHILLNTDFSDIVTLKGGNIEIGGNVFNGKVIYTGGIDNLFNYKYGDLPYRSVDIKFEESNTIQEHSVINYPNNFEYTRITDFSKFSEITNSNKSIICKEYPVEYKKGHNKPYYVINNKENTDLYNLYVKDAKEYKNLICAGRLGAYKYFDMDDAVAAALKLCKMELL